jgi:ABC-2 type transport system ATP-binding protein
MTTHYLEEADLLCNRVALLYKGKVLACDTPASLKQSYVPDRIVEIRARDYTPEIGKRVKEACGIAELLERFEDITTGQVRLRPKWGDSAGSVESVQRELESQGVSVTSVRNVTPTLDDVYFHLAREKVS